MSETMTDVTLVQAAMGGDQSALSAVWRSHRRWVAAILIAHKPREADLEDLLQNVALQVCRKMSEVREPNAFKPWLRTVTINVARGEGRKVTRRKQGMLRLVGAYRNDRNPAGLHDDHVCSPEAERVLEAALQLPEIYREPVLMRCLKSMSYKQISTVLDLPETTIETRIARGRRMLREITQLNENKPEASVSGASITAGVAR